MELFDYQKEGVARALNKQGFMFAFEMGLGKTRTAIEVMRQSAIKSALIVCPAMVRQNWLAEINKWAPEFTSIAVCNTGKKAAALSEDICITSYGLIAKLPNKAFDIIIVDESHYIMNRKSKRTKDLIKKAFFNKRAKRLLLTATPITNQPQNLWSQLNFMAPYKFGSYWDFVMDYCDVESNEWSNYVIVGADEYMAPKLKKQIAPHVMRVTKNEVAHLMPPFICTPIRIEAPKKTRRSLEYILSASTDDILSSNLDGNIEYKIKHIVEYAETTMFAEDHLCIATHKRSSVNLIAQNLKAKFPDVSVLQMDGSVLPNKRHGIISDCLSAPKGVLVTTMHAVKEGINSMVGFDQALLAELYYTPGVITQFLGRFHRLNGVCNVGILCIEGSAEEAIAHTLQEKMKSRDMIYNAGMVDGNFNEALKEDEEEFANSIKAAALNMKGSSYGI